MGALLSLLRSMHSLVVIETARNGNLTSQKYHLRAFGEESDRFELRMFRSRHYLTKALSAVPFFAVYRPDGDYPRGARRLVLGSTIA